MTDPWMITSRERVKYGEQFKSLQPNNGIVTGAQAKGFFLQSQLPPLVLGQIWALADTDCDGKMNLDEFSIACKLINLKLRGFEMPKVLPPTLISSLSSVGGTPTRTPTSAMSPLDPLASLNRPIIPPQPVIPQAIVPPLAAMTNMAPLVSQPPLIPTQPNMMSNTGYASMPPLIPPQPVMSSMPPLIPSQPSIPMQPLIPIGGVPVLPVQPPLISATGGGVIKPLIDTGKMSSPPTEPILPAVPSPPSGTPSRSMSISERAPSIDSPNANVEWAVKGPAKLKYTQMFNTADKNRTGFLTGVQARGLMLQTKLHQTTLAQIWALSDMDSDGRLGCDEFVLAMYLCDLALQGEKIPTNLPLELIPPAFRKSSSRHGSVSGGVSAAIIASSRHGSVSSQGGMQHADPDPTAGLNQTTFEDKRKENFEKGQAELERRRKALLDQQRKEQEERERKEREENDKREKARLEIELRKQQELDRQLQRQREIEQEKEEQRKRALEQKEAARKEMERQRHLEWENQRIQEMQSQKQREQEKVLKLKAQNQNLNIELSTLNEKIKDLSQKICETRPNVTNLKTIIDGMRQTRDSQNSDLTQLRSKIKEQNLKLVHLSQEKAKLDAKNKANHPQDTSNPENPTVAFTNKQILIKQLKDKIQNTNEEIDTKMVDIKTNNETLSEVKTQLKGLLNSCEELYSTYDIKRSQIIEMKNNRKNESYSMAWDTNNASDTNAWPVETPSPVKTVSNNFSTTTAAATTGSSFMKYRALYEFAGRNEDEISFQPGDIIMVPTDLNMEAGWLAGEINGLTGYFPETYVEKMESPTADTAYSGFIQNSIIESKAPLDGIAEIVETTPNDSFNGNLEYYVSCYPYESAELGDLTFSVGEMIMVSKKVGEWWTGTIGTKSGIFPSNYVQPMDSSGSINSETPTQPNIIEATKATSEIIESPEIITQTTINGNNHQMPVTEIKPFVEEVKQISSSIDEAKTQADADSEVSQINTLPQMNEIVRDEFSRPMSTTSTTRNKKPEIAQVIAPYDATSTEQLTLQRGQLIMIRKKTDSGWWEGELQAKGRRRQIGWFPATYVKILQGGRNSGRNTPVSGARIEMSEQVLDKVIALYPYKALNDDELSFEKDDIISVLGRDEPEWWRGELNGITGLFPSNYVGPFVTSGMV